MRYRLVYSINLEIANWILPTGSLLPDIVTATTYVVLQLTMGAPKENGKAPLPSEMPDEAFQACLEKAMNAKKQDLKLTKKVS